MKINIEAEINARWLKMRKCFPPEKMVDIKFFGYFSIIYGALFPMTLWSPFKGALKGGTHPKAWPNLPASLPTCNGQTAGWASGTSEPGDSGQHGPC